MKLYNSISLALGIFFAISCAELPSTQDESIPSPEFFIHSGRPQTKTDLHAPEGKPATVSWSADDAIAVALRKTPTEASAASIYTNTLAAGDMASFGGTADLTSPSDVIAIYPKDAFVRETAEGTVVSIPSVQYGRPGNFPVDANQMSVNPAYAYGATVKDPQSPEQQVHKNYEMTFYNVAGLIEITIPDYLENIVNIEISVKQTPLVGKFNLVLSDQGHVSTFTSLDTQQSVLILYPEAARLKPSVPAVFAKGKYYAVVAPGEYQGFTIKFNTANGGQFVRSLTKGTMKVEKSELLSLPDFIAAPSVGDYFLSDGTWAPGGLKETPEGQIEIGGTKKDVIGYVCSTQYQPYDLMRTEDSQTVISDLENTLKKRPGAYRFHGYVIAKQVNWNIWCSAYKTEENGIHATQHQYTWSKIIDDLRTKLDAYTYWIGHSDKNQERHNFTRCKGYANTYFWKYWLADEKENRPHLNHGGPIELVNNIPQNAPANTSGWYIPSTGDIKNIIYPQKVEWAKPGKMDKFKGNIWTTCITRSDPRFTGGMCYHYPVAYDIDNNTFLFKNSCDVSRQVMYMLAF